MLFLCHLLFGFKTKPTRVRSTPCATQQTASNREAQGSPALDAQQHRDQRQQHDRQHLDSEFDTIQHESARNRRISCWISSELPGSSAALALISG